VLLLYLFGPHALIILQLKNKEAGPWLVSLEVITYDINKAVDERCAVTALTKRRNMLFKQKIEALQWYSEMIL
jgi:hypothetical protein